MTRISRLLAIALAALVLVAAGCGGDDEASDTTDTETTTETTTTEPSSPAVLQGSVGPGFDISLTADGNPVTSLAAGDQLLEVTDQSSAHNFHLTGPGVDVATSVPEEGNDQFSVTLEAGTYNFVCDPHSSSMRGSFQVTG